MQPETPLTEHQADQLRRLTETVDHYPAMQGKLAVVWLQGVREDDVPMVYRELRDLGLVTLTIGDSFAKVAPVRD